VPPNVSPVRRTAAPERIKDAGSLGIQFSVPIGGEVHPPWRHAFHDALADETRRRELPETESFLHSISVTGPAIVFFVRDDVDAVTPYLDAIDAAIATAGARVERERETLETAVDAARERLEQRHAQLDDELQRWTSSHPT
jgi:hypothetical protein